MIGSQEVFRDEDDKKENNLSHNLRKSINKIIQNEGYITHSMSIRDISTGGGSYCSLLKEVDIKGKTVHRNKETNLFIKLNLPDTESQLLPTEGLFLKEIFVYTELAELFDELQNEFKLPDEEKYNFVKYYDDDDDQSLIFDNMKRKGFQILNRLDIVPSKIIESSVKELAKYHGFSVVLQKYRPDFYEHKVKPLKHWLVFDEAIVNLYLSLYKVTIDSLTGERKKKMENYLPGLIEKYSNYVHKSQSKFKCLCHGDYRMNNILVKQKNAEEVTVIPIDYQAIHYGSPVSDFIYKIFMATDRQLRKNEMENWKKIYYESLTVFLGYFDIDVGIVYPRQDFEDDFKNHLEYGLIISTIFLPLILVLEDDVPELNGELKTVKTHYSLKTRAEEIVDDFIEWGYL